MKRNWTDAQKQAINAQGGSIIVSAAAGSGKTAVLVERVVSMITDSEHPVDADRILVVTYTRAAAAELKERLHSKLSELISADPFNKALLRQQTLLNKACISTIDSFCSSIVKEFFYVLDIERNFRIADESELMLIKRDALKLTLDSMYAQGEPDFFRLVEAFGSVKDDSLLCDNILKIHTFLRSHPYPDLWIDEKLDAFSDFDDVADTVWGKILVDYLEEAVSFLSHNIEESFKAISYDETLHSALTPMLERDSQFLNLLKEALSCHKSEAITNALRTFESGRFPTIKGYKDNPIKIKVQNNRSQFKDIVLKLTELFDFDTQSCKIEIADLFVISSQIFNCVRSFSQNYQKLKASKKIADYPDLEHWTIKLLVDEKTGKLTEIAKVLSDRFDQIMIDEYQDANEAQDLIFTALSKNSSNLFFVGDVKQSIYGFRQAEPELFIKRKNNSVVYSEKDSEFPAKIFLDMNFRSIKGVTKIVNFFFEKLMSESVGDIVYDETETLKCGAKYESEDELCSEYYLLDMSELSEPDESVEEAKFIAETIHKMINEGYQVKDGDSYRNATFGDFAVLMRNANKQAPIYVDTLNALGVPSYSNSSYSFLNAFEIMIMTNFLSVIDNPALDIELLSVMMSPIFGFCADDMTAIRLESRYSSLYSAVLKMAQQNDKKCLNFVEELKYYRDLSVTCSVHDLLTVIYERTAYPSIVSSLPEGDLAVNNLRLLKEYAKSFEQGAGKGLSRFVSYLSRLKSNKSDIAGAADLSAANANAVHVMSIHASKGLEFPVCFIANTSKKFVSDSTDNVLLHSKLGIAVKRKDDELNATFNTMPRKALALSKKRDEMSEELRVLYVAMTRAKQKLILLSSHKKLDTYLSKVASNIVDSGPVLPFAVRSCSHLSEWLTMCALLHPDCESLREISNCDITPDYNADFKFKAEVVLLNTSEDYDESDIDFIKESEFEEDNTVVDVLRERNSFVYERSALSKLPSKIAASELAHKLSSYDFDRILDIPAFMNDKALSAAGAGTALHEFMEFCDFSKALGSITDEIDRLVAEGYISQLQAKSIDINKASAFINSNLVQRCLSSEKVYKEFRFTVEVDASIVDDKLPENLRNEKVILQGAVDLAFVENGELVIVDYKTDKVKSADKLFSLYHTQLEIYRDAMEKCTDYKVKEALIYSVHLGEVIEV